MMINDDAILLMFGEHTDYQMFDPEPDVAALVWMMLLFNVGTIVTFVLVMVFVVLRLPALRYLRAHGRTLLGQVVE
jgi:hypothetical protein